MVKANHFFAELPDKDLHQYDVRRPIFLVFHIASNSRLIFINVAGKFSHQVKITPQVTSRSVNRAIIAELVKNYRESHLGGRLPAYDGMKNLYTAGELPFTSKEFQVTLADEDAESQKERFVLSCIV